MSTTWFQRLVLGAAGLTAGGIGLAILAAPVSFYAGYGIEIGAEPSLLSELRAPGANLAALGAIILVGAVRADWTRISSILGATVFSAFAFGRLVSMALDGAPSSALTGAAAIEIAIGLLCLVALQRGGEERKHRLALDVSR